ncbi:type III secretion apparatus protein OrgA/MxiK [Izhakiella capsodis]|uniref:Type III secretion apparatus protein OrgA/MxiK n=1 Tax=Izhakiella capsodis TaxID=1367852 RepID=A0A1I5AUL2_9GAMM|nr:type III secretion protein [Izhakiella capsodis]SFN66133.1 type III secretion apparatus protein OrgA/MxiK [Izhakiella capsodis]
MIEVEQRIMTILYAPAYYTHESYLPETFLKDDIWEGTLINWWLLKHLKLSNLPNAWQPIDTMLSQLIAQWHLIPATAHLIGGYLLRNHLPKQGAVIMSDPRLLAFISLPLLHQITLDDAFTSPDTVSFGITFILGQFPELPVALRQRFLLHFPSGMKLPQFPAPKTLNHINLLRMALVYAHNYY